MKRLAAVLCAGLLAGQAGAGGLAGAALGGLLLDLTGYSGLGVGMGLLSLVAALLTRAALNAARVAQDVAPSKVAAPL